MAEATGKRAFGEISRTDVMCLKCEHQLKDPKMLDCLHSFCLNCLGGRDKITCPVCWRETLVPVGGLRNLSSSFFLISLVDEIQKREQLNLGMALTTSLTCKSRVLQTDLTKNVAPKCRKHSDHVICFHCVTCDTYICSKCAATEHRSAEHNFIEITDSMKSFRKNVTDILENFDKSKQKLACTTKYSIEAARSRLSKNVYQACSSISSKAEEEIQKIRNKAKHLTTKVKELGHERDSEYAQALFHNREQVDRADKMVRAVRNLMRQADDFELIELKPKVMHNLGFQKEFKCEPAKLDMSFIQVKCQDVVRNKSLGEILLKEKWKLKDEFGKEGTGNGEFECATGVACFRNGDIAVTDSKQKRLSLFTSKGQYKTSVAQGANSNQLKAPFGVAVNSDDLLFVTDQTKVKVFDKELHFVREFIPSVDDASDLTGIAVDPIESFRVDKQRVAVADRGRKVISVHKMNGSLITSISNNMVGNYLAIIHRHFEQLLFTNYEEKKFVCVNFQGFEGLNLMTTLNGEPAKATGVMYEPDDGDHGSIYVAVHSSNLGNSEVQKFDLCGAFVSTVAQGLHMPFQMALTPTRDVVVADKHSIKIFERM
ncbi:uncharacterized protein LOC119725158 [Patiria miniata]|uniref:Uncharacterized protein n=1 Tax=Patiria miniata TaxID=46514 RepID=A0A913ZKX0_PATMI|nr:uncharacterized protein LOC119725158 [Patiria miniata]